MKRLFFVTAFVAALTISAAIKTVFGQAAPAPQQQFVPIVLDGPKFDAFYNALQEISMPQKSFQQITALLQNIERQAQQEKAAADAAATPTPASPKEK